MARTAIRKAEEARWRKASTAVAWALVAAWAAVIFAMSAKSGLELDAGTGIVSLAKRWLAGALSALTGQSVDPSPIGHFAEYLVFGALLANALRHHLPAGRAAMGAVGIAAFYAITDEFHQIFVPGRACDPADWLVDVSAAIISALLFALVMKAGWLGSAGRPSQGRRSKQ